MIRGKLCVALLFLALAAVSAGDKAVSDINVKELFYREIANYESERNIPALEKAVRYLSDYYSASQNIDADARKQHLAEVLSMSVAAFRAIARDFDFDFNPNEIPSSHVELSVNVRTVNGFIANGLSPDNIIDEKQRQEYVDALRERDRKIRAYNTQKYLRDYNGQVTFVALRAMADYVALLEPADNTEIDGKLFLLFLDN